MTRAVNPMARGLQAFSAWLNRACWSAGVLFLLIMLGTVALQVIARYIFFSPPAWTEELARYCMVWAGFLGATVSFYKDADPVLATPPARSSSWHGVNLALRSIAVLLFLLPVIYWSPVLLSHHMLRETESMKLVSAYVFAIVPIFSCVILIHIAARLINALADGGATTSEEQR